jgi:hypothetical protein
MKVDLLAYNQKKEGNLLTGEYEFIVNIPFQYKPLILSRLMILDFFTKMQMNNTVKLTSNSNGTDLGGNAINRVRRVEAKLFDNANSIKILVREHAENEESALSTVKNILTDAAEEYKYRHAVLPS